MKLNILLILFAIGYAHEGDSTIKIKHDMEFFFGIENDTHFFFGGEVPQNQYLSIGLRNSMFNTDMILWQANGKNSKGVDLWSRGHLTPDIDDHQDWQTVFESNDTHVTFKSYRRFVSYDMDQDQSMPLVNSLNLKTLG